MVVDKTFPTFLLKRRKPRPSIVYDTYWKFAAERQRVFFNRHYSNSFPWTNDAVLSTYKFTNAYRVVDRTSQYLIREVISKGDQSPSELLFRILLYKIFNKIETWNFLEHHIGEIKFDKFNFSKYEKILQLSKTKGTPIYSGAYMMASGRSTFGHQLKHQNHLRLLEFMFEDDFTEKVMRCAKMEDLYNLLKKYPTIGSFLAYQYAVDINYSSITNFSEMEFVKAGPGARDGIRKCFTDLGEYTEEDIIKLVTDTQDKEFERLSINFQDLWGRSLQLIDCQNLFCEVDKYSRMVHPKIIGISNRTRIKQKYKQSDLQKIDYVFPEKWNLNT